MNRPTPLRRFRKLLPAALLASLALPSIAHAGGSLLVWPVHPKLTATENATALWLENPGDAPITLQVQGFAWAQKDGEDVFAPQKEVVATPPIVKLPAGGKQLVRITRLGPPMAGERAFRLIVDEVPVSGEEGPRNGAAVAFRMRYSLPLFLYGPGLDPANNLPAPILSWSISRAGERQMLTITNSGQTHARLSAGSISGGGKSVTIADGLIGYALPGQSLRVPLPPEAAALSADQLTLAVNGAPAAAIAKAGP